MLAVNRMQSRPKKKNVNERKGKQENRRMEEITTADLGQIMDEENKLSGKRNDTFALVLLSFDGMISMFTEKLCYSFAINMKILAKNKHFTDVTTASGSY